MVEIAKEDSALGGYILIQAMNLQRRREITGKATSTSYSRTWLNNCAIRSFSRGPSAAG